MNICRINKILCNIIIYKKVFKHFVPLLLGQYLGCPSYKF